MRKDDIEEGVLFYAKEIANEIFQIENMTNTHSDYQKERAILSAYEHIRHLIFNEE